MLYEITVNNRYVSIFPETLHQFTRGVDSCFLTLDGEWDGANDVYVVFYRRGGDITAYVPWDGSAFEVPESAMIQSGNVYLTVVGYWDDGDRIVTCEMDDPATVCKGGSGVDFDPSELSKTAVDRLLDMALESKRAADEAVAAAARAEDAAVECGLTGFAVAHSGTTVTIMGGATAGGASGRLPNVTDADEGKVLTVVGGEWAAAELPAYGGEYSVVPTTEDQVLWTSGRFMRGDVAVHAIPYSEVSNTSGGTTATIG